MHIPLFLLRMVKLIETFLPGTTSVPLVKPPSTNKNCLIESEDISLVLIEISKHISSFPAGITSETDTSS